MSTVLPQAVSWIFPFVGNGVASSVSIDMTPRIAADATLNGKAPLSIAKSSTDTEHSALATLSANIITFTWRRAIPNGTVINLSISPWFM
jgi:hypothetical protein